MNCIIHLFVHKILCFWPHPIEYHKLSKPFMASIGQVNLLIPRNLQQNHPISLKTINKFQPKIPTESKSNSPNSNQKGKKKKKKKKKIGSKTRKSPLMATIPFPCGSFRYI
ncbi:unnamed protein product [Citrullus colocynthis]|uniref:Uncharacterized protein n=1 Tax=Citrullus colocynthis TaxID=252529 RepID=A0ABP0YRU6_9ROSI